MFPGLSIIIGYASGVTVHGVTESSVHDDDLCMSVSSGQTGVISYRGRTLQVGDGAATVVTREDGGFVKHVVHGGRGMFLRVPRSAIAPLAPGLDDCLMRVIAPDTGALMLLVKYADVVAQDQAPIAPSLGRLIASHVHDLITLTLGASNDAKALAAGRGVRAARLRTIKADILRNLSDCNLKITAVASRHGVSTRYVHKLFELEGTTFSQFVLEERLTRGYRILADSRFADRRVSSVAFEAGFGDLSYFNQCFRRRYGATPSDIRAQARSAVAQINRTTSVIGGGRS
jgi:AraC-like DNA-binding protein